MILTVNGDEPGHALFTGKPRQSATILEHANPIWSMKNLENTSISRNFIYKTICKKRQKGTRLSWNRGNIFMMLCVRARRVENYADDGGLHPSGPVTWPCWHPVVLLPTAHAYSAKTHRQQWISIPTPRVRAAREYSEASMIRKSARFSGSIEGVKLSASSFTRLPRSMGNLLAFRSEKCISLKGAPLRRGIREREKVCP